jgi:antitoxin (DNA-binding transcriptional repressor) of toxin-antitoxin stability system
VASSRQIGAAHEKGIILEEICARAAGRSAYPSIHASKATTFTGLDSALQAARPIHRNRLKRRIGRVPAAAMASVEAGARKVLGSDVDFGAESPPSVRLIWPSNMATVFLMKKVKVGEFRDRASEMIRRAAGGETIVILNRDREVAKLVPVAAPAERASRLIGCLAGTAEVRGDIEAPIAPPEGWFRDRS